MKHYHSDSASDAHLLERFEESRDPRAFAELVRRHGRMVLATARRVLGSDEDAEDALQATMFALAKSAGKLRQRTAVAAWLHKTAYTCAIGIHRANIRWQKKTDRMIERIMDSEIKIEARDPLMDVAHEELKSILDEELAKLPEHLREVIVRCELEGLPRSNTADQLGISISTVHDRIAKGRKLLSHRLVRRGATFALTGIIARDALSCEVLAASDRFVNDVSSKAALYAAGKCAAEIGVSSTVFQIANKATLAMTKSKLAIVFLAAMTIISFGGSLAEPFGTHTSAFAKTVFLDDFSDTNIMDDDPVNWVRLFNAGQLKVEDGSLVVTGTTADGYFATIAGEPEAVTFTDTSLRAQVRLVEGDGIGVAVRRNETLDRSYFAVLRADTGTAVIGIGGNIQALLEETPVEFDVRQEDILVQLDAIGDTIKFWAWPADETMPIEPLLTAEDESVPEGQIFLFVGNADSTVGSAEGAFRFVHLATTSIPEPSCSTLCAMGLLGLLAARRQIAVSRRA